MLLRLQDLETLRQRALVANNATLAASILSEEQSYLKLVQVLVDSTATLAGK